MPYRQRTRDTYSKVFNSKLPGDSFALDYAPRLLRHRRCTDRAVHSRFNNLGSHAIIIRLHGGVLRGKCTTFPDLGGTSALPNTEVRERGSTRKGSAARCAGITTNEVLNLNKLQGSRLPSTFSFLPFFRAAPRSLSAVS